MSQKTITISEETYQKLANLAIGFDTPDNVIQRLLNSVGSLDILDDSSKPKLIFVPNEASFKNELISKRRAEVILYFSGMHQNFSIVLTYALIYGLAYYEIGKKKELYLLSFLYSRFPVIMILIQSY